MLKKMRGIGKVSGSRDAVAYLYFCLRSMGIYAPANYRVLYYIYAAFLMFIICILAPLTFNMGLLLEKSMTTGQMLTLLQADLNVWGIPIKAVTLGFFVPRLLSTEKYMQELDAQCTQKIEHQHIRHMVMSGNGIVIFYATIYFMYGFSSYVLSFSSGHPLYALYLFIIDWRNSSMEFFLQAVVEYIVVFTCIYFQVAQDSYPAVYIRIIRTHVRILAARVERLGTEQHGAKNDKEKMSALVQCIVDHNSLLNLYRTVSPIISITMFIQFTVAAAIMSITMVNIVLFADNATRIGSAVYLVAVMVQTAPTCYQASLLIDDSMLLPAAIFHCNWMDQTLSFRKMVVFFMQHTQVPMDFNALKIFPITLATNLDIIKFSFSLFTLLRNADLGGHNKGHE